MDMIIKMQLQECLELCQRMETLLQEHREEAARAMDGELYEAYARAILQADEMVDALKSRVRELYNSKTVM